MNAIEALLTRNSIGKLTAPAPAGEALQNILKAATHANDHKRLRPWKFLVIEGDARNRLGELYVQAALAGDASISLNKQQDIASKTQRAPMILVVVADLKNEPKVPEIEQVLSAAGAAQLVCLAAHAQGFGSMWRTGDMAYNDVVKKGLGLSTKDHIVGFIYLGTPAGPAKPADVDENAFVVQWKG